MTPTTSDPGGRDRRDLSQLTHRWLIGILGFLLPLLVVVIAGLRSTRELEPWELLPSVSAYYYTGSIGVFVGVLFALSLFLFTYPGYERVSADRVVGRVGGLAALGVALFPTDPPGGLSAPSWWRAGFATVHNASAVVLFGAFIVFSIWLFRKSSVPDRRSRPADKRWRDAICLGCGIAMIVCVLWAAGIALTKKVEPARIFWPEAIAIEAFAVSWLAKGEALGWLLRVLGMPPPGPTAS